METISKKADSNYLKKSRQVSAKKQIVLSAKKQTASTIDNTKDNTKDNSQKKGVCGGNSPAEKQIQPGSGKTEGLLKRLWAAYPARDGRKRGKAKAMEYIRKQIHPDDYPALERAVNNYANCGDTKRGIGIMDMIRFLRQWREWVGDGDNGGGDEESQTKKARLAYREKKALGAGKTAAEDERLKADLAKIFNVSVEVFK